MNDFMNVLRDLSLGLLATGIGIVLKYLEAGIVEPAVLDAEPYYVAAVQFELMLTAVGLLYVYTPDTSIPPDQRRSVKGVWVGILFAFLSIFASIVTSARSWEWAQNNEAFFAVLLPDAIGIFVLIFVVGVASKDVRSA